MSKAPLIGDVILTAEEEEIFVRARAAGDGLRRSFDGWVSIGRATEIARRHADAPGGSKKKRGARFRSILDANGFKWLTRNEASQVLMVMSKLNDVKKWREGLTDFQRVRWSSPQSTLNRAPCFGRNRGVRVKARPMSLSELLKMPASESALLLYRRCPSKAFAIWRALQELIDTGSAVKPKSGWAAGREHAAGATAAAA